MEPFTVYCDMSTSPPTTLLHHSEETETAVQGYEVVGSFTKRIIYNNNVSWRQARSIVTRSESCYYQYTEKCLHSIMTGFTYWEAYDGQIVQDLVGTTDTLCRSRGKKYCI